VDTKPLRLVPRPEGLDGIGGDRSGRRHLWQEQTVRAPEPKLAVGFSAFRSTRRQPRTMRSTWSAVPARPSASSRSSVSGVVSPPDRRGHSPRCNPADTTLSRSAWSRDRYFPRDGYTTMKFDWLGIFTFGNVRAFISSFSPMIPLRLSRYAVTAYTSSSLSDRGLRYGIARRT
jgi:hypothetical protein